MFGCSGAGTASSDDAAGSGTNRNAPSGSGASGGSSASGTGGALSAGRGGSAGSSPIASGGGSGGSGGSGTAGTSLGGLPEADDAEVPGDRYDAPGTQPFVMTAHDPLSTFAADVDTASYDIFRRDANDGRLSDPASVRLEEYVNSFRYSYPAPEASAGEPFAIHLAAAPSLYDTGTLLFRVGIQGKVAEPAPANLVYLVDVSGSMSAADKLPLVKVVMTESLKVLQPTDLVSIVTYAGSTTVALAPTLVSDADSILPVIESLTAGGSTAGASGIDLAYEQAEAAYIEDGINHVVMCTDGDFNVGPYTNTELISLIEQKRTTGVTLTALGFGYGNLNDSMMEAVSNAGNGMYAVISNEDHAIEYANDQLLSTMIHIAKDMKIQVEFNPEHVVAYRLLGYENRAIADDQFRDDTVDAGEVGAGHRVTALYEIVPSSVDVPTAEGAPDPEDGDPYDGDVEVDLLDLVLVKVRYKEPGAAEEDPAFEVAESLPVADAATSYADLDADFRWAYAVASFAEVLKESPYARTEHLEGIARIVEAEAEGKTGDRAEFATLFTIARPMIEAR
jgi:Ca-activated chloride channel family protein